jgi:hypothetical protein
MVKSMKYVLHKDRLIALYHDTHKDEVRPILRDYIDTAIREENISINGEGFSTERNKEKFQK